MYTRLVTGKGVARGVMGLVCAVMLLVCGAECRPVNDNSKLQWTIFDILGKEGI
jgi:hypothetical protein